MAKVPASTHPSQHQCPGLCKASTNFNTRFAQVQKVRFDFIGVLFYVVTDFPCYISLLLGQNAGKFPLRAGEAILQPYRPKFCLHLYPQNPTDHQES